MDHRFQCTKTTGFCFVVALLALSAALLWLPSAKHVRAGSSVTTITIDYPLRGSIFPSEITAPTFLWHDANPAATRWVVVVTFAKSQNPLRFESAGDLYKPGEIDTRAGTDFELSPELASAHTWAPDDASWKTIKQLSVAGPATFTISGYTADPQSPAISSAETTLTTSSDPIGAPIFYRNVPLMITPSAGGGAIQPLPPSALPLIKWQLRYLNETKSHTMMENLPTCANCHSFSADGKTLGIDMDGPRNDKGLYGLVSLTKNTTITNRDVIRWASFQEDPDVLQSDPTVKRFGFMSQVSPDGRYVITSIAPKGTRDTHGEEAPGFAAGVVNRLFSVNYKHIDFTQVFFPTRGVLAWYDRADKKLRTLPGADDPEFVQTSAFWSPDGKYLIYSRAHAQDPFPPGAPKPTYANDPNEPQVQYDLYKIPFNNGHGGKAEPIAGASNNGKSNNFPKVSPDGKWIVFVQNKTGLLMRPDSHLYMVPFNGGTARLMNCNQKLMNSWHSFSPNGRWLAFSSKGRSPYTQLMLTHIDANGNDSPAIMVENTTAANRAVNIPEFVNIPPGNLESINPQATDFYKIFNEAYTDIENNHVPEAADKLRAAIELDPDDALAHYGLATTLSALGRESEALVEYRKACELNPLNSTWLDHLAISYTLNNDMNGAVATWTKAIATNPKDANAETDLGSALFESGNKADGLSHMLRAIEVDPKMPEAHNHLGLALLESGELDKAIPEFQRAVELRPKSAEFRFYLGTTLAAHGDTAQAIDALKQSVELSEGKNPQALVELAKAYHRAAKLNDAIDTLRKAKELALQAGNSDAAAQLDILLQQYTAEK
jgi:Flp pilus assembly protein TadD